MFFRIICNTSLKIHVACSNITFESSYYYNKHNITCWKEGSVLLNYALNTFYLRLYTLREIAQWVHHEGSIQQPNTPYANALTTELHLAPITCWGVISVIWYLVYITSPSGIVLCLVIVAPDVFQGAEVHQRHTDTGVIPPDCSNLHVQRSAKHKQNGT